MDSWFTFDFDQWATLSRTDPKAFEHLRAQVMESYYQQMNVQARPWFEKIRWRIDMERARSHTPLQCCIRLSSLMWDRFFDLNEILQSGQSSIKEQHKPGQIVAFSAHPETKK